MNNLNYFKALKNNWRLIVAAVALVVLVGLVITAFQPFRYRSTVQLLTIANQDSSDAYSAIRSAEKINSNLSRVIYTSSFQDKVAQFGFLSKNAVPTDPAQRKDFWDNAVATYAVPETGILKIEVYHQNRQEATNLAKSIAYVLSTSGNEYVGPGAVTIKTIDQPITSNYPVKPNIPLNLVVSVALGFILSLGYVLLASADGEEVRMPDWLEGKSEVSSVAKMPVGVLAKSFENPEVARAENEWENTKVEIAEENIPVVSQDQEAVIPVVVEAEAEPVAEIEKTDEASDEDAKAFYKLMFPEKDKDTN